MTNYQILGQELRDGFRNNKGKGSIFLYKPINPIVPMLYVLSALKNKLPNRSILIVIDKYDTKKTILSLIKEISEKQEVYEYMTKNVIFITKDYINFKYNYDYNCAILIGINDLSIIDFINRQNKFCLAILTEAKLTSEELVKLRTILPNINVTIDNNKFRHDNVIQPVKEIRYEVTLSEDDDKLYKEYTDYIRNGMRLFGDIETLNLCRIGDSVKNISAKDICRRIAAANGWSYNLDMSVEINIEIDKYFNPNVIAETAQTLYDIIRKRKQLIYNNQNKLPVILKIVKENFDKKTLIVSKNGEFAHDIANYLNKELNNIENTIVCGEYHDAIPETYITDENNNIICYKSGANKGKPKLFKSQALSSHFLALYDCNYINILSIKNNVSNDLKCPVDLIIFTSSLDTNIIKFKQRYRNITFVKKITDVRRLYTIDTIEEKELLQETKYSNIEIIENKFSSNIEYNEEYGEIII